MRTDHTDITWSSAIAAGVILATLALPAIARAQVETGSVSGSVGDRLGGLVGGATVTLTNDTTDVVRTARSSTDARFEFTDVPPGAYSLRVTYPGFGMAYLAITLDAGQLLDRAIELPMGELKELIRVSSDGAAAPAGQASAARAASTPAPSTTPGACASPPCVTPAVKVFEARPEYPAAAVARGAQGIVLVEATITTQGTIGDIKVLRSVDAALDDAAVAAIRQWEFIPTLLNGVPVASLVQVTVEFGSGSRNQ